MRAFANGTEGSEVTTGFYSAGQVIFEGPDGAGKSTHILTIIPADFS